MKALILVCSLSLGSVALADISEIDNNKTTTVDCKKDPSVDVAGNHNTYTLEGTCKAVRLSGNGNTVKGEAAKSVSISGNENTVTLTGIDTLMVTGNKNTATWKKPATAKKTSVSNLGEDNKLAQAK